ncbi:hypothetical protein ONA02_04330 [Mycoplasmopsis felis]|uniref:hypothetical protein n=1 Tax=Mycoplasmopsis felis TaxID=33923 RepID=UPI0021E0C25A|nr:hypothetical protein [Mycoplasmopsis felis]MCU9931473.1 hypothetical protein [Mycoplasmopsis felis]WAM01865.1 hypothetical protein ONA02_04330 [Mycoplasmopsis felis]
MKRHSKYILGSLAVIPLGSVFVGITTHLSSDTPKGTDFNVKEISPLLINNDRVDTSNSNIASTDFNLPVKPEPPKVIEKPNPPPKSLILQIFFLINQKNQKKSNQKNHQK